MKKFICITALLLIPLILLAQGQAPDGDVGDVSFINIAKEQSPMEIFVWVIVSLLSLIGIIMGLTAIIVSSRTKSLQIPLSVKLLPCGTALLFILGCLVAVQSIIHALYYSGTTIGAAREAYLNVVISEAFHIPAFALQGGFFYMLFFTISVILLHFNHQRIRSGNEEMEENHND